MLAAAGADISSLPEPRLALQIEIVTNEEKKYESLKTSTAITVKVKVYMFFSFISMTFKSILRLRFLKN